VIIFMLLAGSAQPGSDATSISESYGNCTYTVVLTSFSAGKPQSQSAYGKL